MAACSTRAQRFSDDSSGLIDSEQKSHRSQCESTRKLTQEADDGKKRCAGSKSKKGAKGGGKKIDDGVGDRIDEGVVEGIDGGVNERVGEEIDGGLGEGIGEGLGGGIDCGVGEGVGRLESAEAITCLCDCKVEKGEMVCCDVCESWSHLRCMGMKEGVGLMEGKVFVCHFCLSACLLALQKEVRELKKELHITKCEVKGLREENGKLKEHIEHDRSGEVRVAQKEVVKKMTRGVRLWWEMKLCQNKVNNEEGGEKSLRMWADRGVR